MPRPELRALVEAQAERDDPRAYWAVGERMTAWIGAQPGADVERYRAVADGFVPDREAPFRVWHGVEWSGERTAYRVYLSCRAGPEPRARLVRALDALGARPAFERCERALRQPAEPTILSLDLGPPGRVKVYLLHAAASWDELRPLVELGGADVEDAARFVARASGGRPARWLTASTIDGDEVTRVALHFGLLRRGRPVEQAPIATLVRDVARDLGLDAGPYELLRRNAGPHHFISFQAWNGAPRLTTYFGPAA